MIIIFHDPSTTPTTPMRPHDPSAQNLGVATSPSPQDWHPCVVVHSIIGHDIVSFHTRLFYLRLNMPDDIGLPHFGIWPFGKLKWLVKFVSYSFVLAFYGIIYGIVSCTSRAGTSFWGRGTKKVIQIIIWSEKLNFFGKSLGLLPGKTEMTSLIACLETE